MPGGTGGWCRPTGSSASPSAGLPAGPGHHQSADSEFNRTDRDGIPIVRARYCSRKLIEGDNLSTVSAWYLLLFFFWRPWLLLRSTPGPEQIAHGFNLRLLLLCSCSVAGSLRDVKREILCPGFIESPDRVVSYKDAARRRHDTQARWVVSSCYHHHNGLMTKTDREQ